MTYPPVLAYSFSFITVNAGTGSDVTQLSIAFPVSIGNESVILNGTKYWGGETAQISLNSLEILQIQSKHWDVYNVYSGVNRTSVINKTCLSHLLDQMTPTERAGNSYVTIPFPKRETGDLCRGERDVAQR